MTIPRSSGRCSSGKPAGPRGGALHRALRHARVAAAAASLLLVAGVAAAPAVHTVTIDGFEFRPPVVTVRQGDAIVWRNSDPLPHTATGKTGSFDSGSIAAGGTFRFTAAKKGRFDYICTLHPTMKGVLVVE